MKENIKQQITEVYFQVINQNNLELFRIIKEHLEELEPILPLIEFTIERLETVADLTINNRIWDAEIILRSALETLVKLIFITNSEEPERNKRIDEFWNSLSEINSLKQSEQAKKNFKHFGKSSIHKLAYEPILLPKDLENQLREKWPRVERKKMEQKWSFSEIINSLAMNYRGNSMEIFESLTHGYRMSSHVAHGDETGILIIRERNSREKNAKNIAYFTHYQRLLSDISTFCALIAVETMHYLKLKPDFFFKNQELLKEVNLIKEDSDKELFSDKDYDKFRETII